MPISYIASSLCPIRPSFRTPPATSLLFCWTYRTCSKTLGSARSKASDVPFGLEFFATLQETQPFGFLTTIKFRQSISRNPIKNLVRQMFHFGRNFRIVTPTETPCAVIAVDGADFEVPIRDAALAHPAARNGINSQ
jgi:hypothetical protein